MTKNTQGSEWEKRLESSLEHIVELYPNEIAEIKQCIASERLALLHRIKEMAKYSTLDTVKEDV